MEISAIPANIYHRLMLVGGSIFVAGEALPGGKPTDPKIWLIVFSPAKTDSTLLSGDENTPDGETRDTVPAKYLILMREADGKLGDQVLIHEVWAEHVLIASRVTGQNEAIDEFTALIKEELGDDAKVDLQTLLKKPSNGQQPSATP